MFLFSRLSFSLLLCSSLWLSACAGPQDDDPGNESTVDASDSNSQTDSGDPASAGQSDEVEDSTDPTSGEDAQDPADESDDGALEDDPEPSDPTEDPDEIDNVGEFELLSDVMQNDGSFPVRYACTWYYSANGAENISPHLAWREPPQNTESFAIVLRDLTFDGFLHSIIFDIPADVMFLPEALPREAYLDEPAGAKQSRGYTGDVGYEGPCPGWNDHTYQFEIYALSVSELSNVTVESGMEQIETAIISQAMVSATLTALFTAPQ